MYRQSRPSTASHRKTQGRMEVSPAPLRLKVFTGASAQLVEALGERELAAREHRRVAQGVAARLRLAGVLHEGEGVRRGVSLERPHEILVVKAERGGRVQLHPAGLRPPTYV